MGLGCLVPWFGGLGSRDCGLGFIILGLRVYRVYRV